MKVVQIVALDSHGIVGLTDVGRIFMWTAGIWEEVSLPDEFPEPVFLDRQATDADAGLPDDPAPATPPPLPGARKINIAALPPKLAALVSDDSSTRFCEACGMPMKGVTCIECAL